MDKRAPSSEEEGGDEFEMENHVVLMEYNELSTEIADFYSERGQKVLLLDLDPDITEYFESQHGHSNIHAHYANMQDPESGSTWNSTKQKWLFHVWMLDRRPN